MDAPNLSRAHLIQGTRTMRFQEVYEGWRERRLSQSEAAEILGVCERSFRRYSARYEDSEGDLNSLADKRLSQGSKRRASGGEIDALIALYRASILSFCKLANAADLSQTLLLPASTIRMRCCRLSDGFMEPQR